MQTTPTTRPRVAPATRGDCGLLCCHAGADLEVTTRTSATTWQLARYCFECAPASVIDLMHDQAARS